MPTPRKNEKQDDFIQRCIPVVLQEGTADDQSQAVAICHSIWERSKKHKESQMKWYEIKNKSDVSEIWLYDEIGLFGIGAKEFIAELNGIKSPNIDMHINSPGGGVFDGAAIYNAIKRHPSKVTSYIDGIAASIASIIALAGEKVVMAKNAMFMLHNPSGMVLGTAADMRKTADILDKVRDTMIGAYTAKSGKTDEEVVGMLETETWMDADEAMNFGFVDQVGDEIDLAACAKFIPTMSKLGYKNVPNFHARREIPSEKEIERFLRDAGCSRKVAKSILAKGYSDDLRDADAEEVPPPEEEVLRDAELSAEAEDGQATEPEPKEPALDWLAELKVKAERIAPSKTM